MRIKKLEIAGFKSFAERARLHFGAGITGVVGPNGCGKSNIVDAMRWCMGEMSAKHLRGRAMQDVIFAGSDNHGPLGMAEVTLTFDNEGAGAGAEAGAASYSEVAVTRRLFRDGTSEYLINKVPVRLRDVTDLFLGTGVGTRAYSIIEQGRIGFIVNSRPEDRRTLIEEVAGITKFKVRKKAAERRMESTEQNLLRVNDVVGELERQLVTLRRQAKKAERYKELKAELRHLELHRAVQNYLRLGVLARYQEACRADIEAQMRRSHAGLLAEESQLEAQQAQLTEQERQLQRDQALVGELEARHAAFSRDLQHWQQQLREARERGEAACLEAAEAAQRIDEATAERARLEADKAHLTQDAATDDAGIEQGRRQVEALQEQLETLDEELEVLRRRTLQHVQGAAKQRALITNLEQQRGEAQRRAQAAEAEKAELLPRQAQLEVREAELLARRAQLSEELTTWRAQVTAWRQALPAVRAACQDSAAKLAAHKESLGKRRQRLASLEEIVRRLDGYSDGVRSLLGDRAVKHDVAGLRTLVAQILEVPPQLERAVEAVLGDKLQYVLVDGQNSASAAVAFLKAKAAGRSGFIPCELAAAPQPSGGDDGGNHHGAGRVGPALAQVSAPAEYSAVLQYLLGDVWLVETLNEAQRCQKDRPGWTCVSLEGDVVDAAGVVTGGSNHGAGLLANRREIRELHKAVAAATAELQVLQAAHDAHEQERLQLEINMTQLGKDIHVAELQALEVSKDAEASTRDLRRVAERLAAVQASADQCGAALGRLEQEATAAMAAAADAESHHEEIEWRTAEVQERRQIQSAQLQERQQQLTAAQVRQAAHHEKVAAHTLAMQRLDKTVEDLRQRVARSQSLISQCGDKVEALGQQTVSGEAQAVQQDAELQQKRAALQAARAAYEAQRTALIACERDLKERRRGGEALHDALLACKVALQQGVLELQQLEEQTYERHDVCLRDMVHDFHTQPRITQAQEKRTEELTRSIRALGAVNLTAIAECAEIEQRYAFLVVQRDDMQQALEALKKAIASINRASRERFGEAFAAVNEMFQKVYPRLFRGGVARLELTQSDDLLDAGVEIVAQPPGKKLQSVQLLSGGEKALTATALIFAIFLIKPSPFCILDEVDAPLDEANVNRFNDMLREISQVSQFIVITHNKQTMLQADKLYGITMQEPGRSKVVAVDLAARDKEAAA